MQQPHIEDLKDVRLLYAKRIECIKLVHILGVSFFAISTIMPKRHTYSLSKKLTIIIFKYLNVFSNEGKHLPSKDEELDDDVPELDVDRLPRLDLKIDKISVYTLC